jgi:hypothetical protein
MQARAGAMAGVTRVSPAVAAKSARQMTAPPDAEPATIEVSAEPTGREKLRCG